MHAQHLLKELQGSIGKRLHLKVRDYRSTMLSVKWDHDCTRVSLHRIFLKAPEKVRQSLASYLQRKGQEIPKTVKFFIDDHIKTIDQSFLLNPKKLCSLGATYDLKKIYDNLNAEYFDNKLSLHITWFGKPNQRNRSSVTFGLYHDPLKLIKIHRILDTPSVPDYLVSYVVYHEMVHHICPSYRDRMGKNRIHNKEFREKEEKFQYYQLAKHWIKEHQTQFFKGMF